MECRYESLVNPLKNLPGMEELLLALKNGKNVKVTNLIDACKGHFMYGVDAFVDLPMIVLTYDEVTTKNLCEDLQNLKGKDKVYIYPSRDILFYNADVHSMEITAERIKILDKLAQSEDITIIMPVEALLNPVSPIETWRSYAKKLEVGQTINLTQFETELVQMGYERVQKVEAIGQFAIRGGIIDIYTPVANRPCRIELWDVEIDSIREFNPETQRSTTNIECLKIVPNQEIVFPPQILKSVVGAIKEDLKKVISHLKERGYYESIDRIKMQVGEVIEQVENDISPKGLELYVPYTNLKTVSVLDYIPSETLVYINEPAKIEQRLHNVLEEYSESMKDRLEYGHILPGQIAFIFEEKDVYCQLENYKKLLLMNFETTDKYFDTQETMPVKVQENSSFYKNLDLMEKSLKEWKAQDNKIAILSASKAKADRLVDELERRNIIADYTENMNAPLLPGQIKIYKGALQKGFYYEDIGLYIIADQDLFGKEKTGRKSKRKYKGSKIQSFLELTPGDYVVHEQHGIGIFRGIEQIVFEGISRDNLKIEYADNNILYVNINQMDQVQKYVGAEGKQPKISKLGGSEWRKSKTKVKSVVKDIAKDLIKLYSKREHARGFKYEPDTIWQREFEELFPYEETEDQLEAIDEVKKDMESDKIMDRLICGDVGYGKTEVAIRAAFKAVQNNKQVAYLVPTTILAKQHYERFVTRLEEYAVNVELLCRFRTPKQIKETLEHISSGKADVVIGTHRLLSKDVKFKDLGLVIIDEEQRFGVTHKEKLKQMRTQVDVMNLTATPIPRTLHMSLIGIRDMSILEEAPHERKPVQTYVIEYSEDFIKDAINRELIRDGQVYFLHNQVRNIEEMTERIRRLVPNARVGFAHGQMSERELENIMSNFIERELDVLVCTTIIETGLDISNVNTIIINDADRMGLSQLYQLRGRVGRSTRTGYAYLMYQKNKALKEVAEKRLQAIKQFTQLGAGFKIAMRDLEIRGAGNLLGAQQHGHMESVGYDLYCKLLEEAVQEEKGEKIEEEFETTIEIKVNAYIPSDYIENEVEKLDIYKKIASIKNQKDYYNIQEEIEDRYGTIPESINNLLDIALIKAWAHDIYIVCVSENNKAISFTFKEDADLNSDKLLEVIKQYSGSLKFVSGKEKILRAQLENVTKKERLAYIKNMLQQLKKLKNPLL